ncbi:RES family NAD+ phosphorylase [Massilia sp. erpn]|nr:RES family NAD+ phosphorylase [Massilia sp. erpn]
MPEAGMTGAPPAQLHLAVTVWKQGELLHRVHQDKYAADQFNPGLAGNARFSPIQDAQGHPIPTLYGGASFACAVMETVFHDIPFGAGLKTFDKAKLAGQLHAQLRPEGDLLLADLSSKALRHLGIERKQLIDTEKDQYPFTRPWAAAIHAQRRDLQGLCWTSRQDDEAKAVMLFGDRIAPGLLQAAAPSRSLSGDQEAYGELLDLAALIGVLIVPGRQGSDAR